ncbi:MAG: hypothetical protein AYK22_07280 [Thermoplasmatales archaeon SG8-52-3]|nr:MAG: hypothetical protein AYK22_07280 [Thermoplasmatales archaeon SG8-52-3]
MLKKRNFSTQDDFKTGFFCKITLFFGFILLLIFLFIKISALIIGENSIGIAKQIYDFSQTTVPNTVLAFSILLLGTGAILYFFNCQFSKLAKIADEIENSENVDDVD